MISQVAVLALLAPLISALTLHLPQTIDTSSPVTITWDTSAGDPDFFSLLLVNTEFNDSFAIANTIDPATGSITLTLPVVPVGGGYTLEAVNIGDVNDVYSTTAGFSIGAASSSSATGSSTASSASGTSSATSRSVTTSAATTSTSIRSVSATSSAPASTTTNNDATNPSATPLSGALSLKFSAGMAAAVLAGVAGAAVMAL